MFIVEDALVVGSEAYKLVICSDNDQSFLAGTGLILLQVSVLLPLERPVLRGVL